jgi:hypothetical protein
VERRNIAHERLNRLEEARERPCDEANSHDGREEVRERRPQAVFDVGADRRIPGRGEAVRGLEVAAKQALDPEEADAVRAS